jgi:hypothetical protein
MKISYMRFVTAMFGLVVAAATPASGVVDSSFDRYQVILDRKPFGEALMVAEQPVAQTVPQSESFAKTIRMSALIEEDDGSIRVGLIDTASNDNFFISEGEIINGVELVSASYEDEEAVLRRGAEMAVIQLQSGEVQALTPAEQKDRLAERDARSATRGRLSYAERRRARQEARKKAAEEAAKQPEIPAPDLQKHLQEYQMEVIRQGLPPLPVPLTPEMDAQLVAEGVLPP